MAKKESLNAGNGCPIRSQYLFHQKNLNGPPGKHNQHLCTAKPMHVHATATIN